MSISSLILRSSSILAFVLCTLLDSSSAQSTPIYTLDTEYSGSTFFDGWNFFDEADPTHGFVTYVNEATAAASGLIQTGSGSARMNVDSTHTYNPNTGYYGVNGVGRPSVRIESKKSWTHGLFIAKIDHMPGGICGTWPAWWTLGSGEWPYNGEIDIIESVNNRNKNTAALHTAGEATITNGQSNNCQWNGGNSVGCTIADTDPASYGTQYNAQGGGTWAMQWTSDAIKIWSFPHGQVPANVDSANPDPSTWGTPSQTFGGPNLHVDSNFKDHRMVFDTTFCGDFADAVWTSEGCAAQTGYSTCAAYVAKNPAVFANAYWQVGYVRVFQQSGSSSSNSQSGATTSASKSIPAVASSSIASNRFTSPSSQASLIPPASLFSKSSSTADSSSYPNVDPTTSSNAYSFHPIATGFSTVSPPSTTFLLGSSSSTSESTVTFTLVGSSTMTSTLTLVHIGSSTTLSTSTTTPSVQAFTKSTTTTTISPTTSSVPAIKYSTLSYSSGSMEVGPPVMAGTSETSIAATLSTGTSSMAQVSTQSDSNTVAATTATPSGPGIFVTVGTSSSIISTSASTSQVVTTLVTSSFLQSPILQTSSLPASSAVSVSTSSTSSASLDPISTASSAITQTVVPLPATPSPSPTQSETPDSTTNSITPTPTGSTDQSDQGNPFSFPHSHGHGHGHWRGSFFRGNRPPVLRTRDIEARAFPDFSGFSGFSGFNPFRLSNRVTRIEYVCPSTKKRAAAPEPEPEPEQIPTMNEAPMTQTVETTSTSEPGSESTQDISSRSIPVSIGQTYAAAPVAVEAYSNDGSVAGISIDSDIIAGLGLDASWLKVFCVGVMMSGFWVLGFTI